MKTKNGGWGTWFLIGICLAVIQAGAQTLPDTSIASFKGPPPMITGQPANQAVIQGGHATFSVTATGAVLNYQWKFDGTNLLAGRTNATLTLTNVLASNAGAYAMTVSNAGGSVTSASALLTVITSPVITAQPANQNVFPWGNATFNVTAAGGALNYQWWFDGTNRLAGQTNSALTLTHVQSASAGNYFVVVTNLAGAVTSSNAVLTVLVQPAITAQPASQTVIQGSAATFEVTATGGALNYQWRFNGNNLPGGQTNATLTLTNVLAANAGGYSVFVSNPAGWVTSASAMLTVLVPPTITAQPTNQTVIQGSNVVFRVTATGSTNLSYSWWFDGTNLLAGATSATLALTNVQAANSGGYSVVVANLAGSVTSSNAVLTVLTPPMITTQPASQNVASGSNATFSVTATGGALHYQWKFNGTNLPAGRTNATLTLTDVLAANAGSYSVVVTNRLGSVTSSNAVLAVFPPPTITEQPANVAVLQGGTATFNVTATGGDLSYQWLFDGSPLPADNIISTVAGNNSLGGGYSGDGGAALNAALNAAAGVWVSQTGNLYIADTGNNVIRLVNASGTITTVVGSQSLGGGYSGDDGAATNAALSGPNGILEDGAGNLYIADSGNNVIREVTAGGLITTVAGNNSLGGTYSGDGGAAADAGLNTPVGMALDGAGNLYIGDAHNNVVRKVDVNGVITTVAGNNSLGGGYSGDGGAATNAALNYPAEVAVDGAGNLYVADTFNFVIRKVSPDGTITTVAGNNSLGGNYSGDGGAATNAGLNIMGGVVVDGTGNLYIADTINNVIRKVATNGIITTVAGNNSLGGGYSGDGGAATNAGLNFPFGVALDAAGNLLVADCHNNVIREIAAGFNVNATNGTLTLTDAQGGMSGNYQVVVSNPYGSTASTVASLTVHTPPAIIVAPAGQTVVQGSKATFSVTATGGGLNYQWWLDGTNLLAGQTNSTFTLTNALMVNDGDYYVTITNLYGSVASPNAMLTVVAPPVITEEPTNETVDQFATVTLNVTATGGGLSYQWWFNGSPVYLGSTPSLELVSDSTPAPIGGPALAGAIAVGLGVAPLQAGSYWVVVTNLAGTVISSNVVVTVVTLEPPAITGQPTDQTVVQGGNATFGVAAAGEAVNYEWWFNGNILAGQTNATLALTDVTAAEAGTYYVDVGNDAGWEASSNAVLTVATQPTITAQPTNVTVTQFATNVTFSVTAAGGALNYQWWFNETLLTGATNTTLTLASVLPSNAGNYFVVISNPAGSVASSNAVLTVISPPVITTQPGSEVVRQGSNALFSVSASGGGLKYRWRFNGRSLVQGTNSTLVLANVQPANVGTYSVMVSNIIGATLSSNATLTLGTAPVITSQPTNEIVAAGGNAMFTVTATGGALTYQWWFGTNANYYYQPLAGQTNATLTVTNVQLANAGFYSVVITNMAGFTYSTNAELTVVTPPPTITGQPANQTVLQGGTATFSVTTTSGNLTFQWLFNGSPLPADDTITTVAGDYSLGGGYSGDGGLATNATLKAPGGVFVDQTGDLYIADTGNNVIRKVNADGTISTVAGDQSLGGGYSGDGGAATNAALGGPNGILEDGQGNLYFAEANNNVVRKVTVGGLITTVAGNNSLGGTYAGDGGAAADAGLNTPVGIALDGAGNLYISDAHNNVVRKVDVNGVITTVAGNQSLGGGYAGDGGAATNAALNYPSGLALDGAGNLYIADAFNFVVREVSAGGTITTVAGDNSLGGGYSGDGGAATNAGLDIVNGLSMDGAGNLYIADTINNVVRKVGANGIITTVAGSFNLSGSYSGDGAAATNAGLNFPIDIALDGAGNLYLADSHNNVVRQVTAGNHSVNATNGALTLTNVQPGMAGNYQVVVSNLAGPVTSSNAVLTVTPAN